jgi:FkbM family methyltransferase
LTSPGLRDRFLTAWCRRRWRGFFTLRRLLARPVIETATPFGALFSLRPEDYIDGIVLRDGFYEHEVLTAMRPWLAPGAVFWDIGANFGLHAVSVAISSPGVHVVAFEPNPSMFGRLQSHCGHNRVAVRCQPLALGSRDGTATLHVNDSGNPGMTTLVPWSGTTYGRQVEVQLVRADTLIARGDLPAPTVVKLDVEGAEADVLEGFGVRLKDASLRAVVLETRADLLDDPTRCPAACRLQSAGFEFRPLARAEGSEHALNNFLATRLA